MKNQKSKLDFAKHSIVELSNNMNQVKGGHPITTIAKSSWVCGIAVVAISIFLVAQFEIDFNYDAH